MARSANRVVALVVGVALLALGVAGLVLTADMSLTDPVGALLVGFASLNPLQSLAHLLLALPLLVAAWAGRTWSRLANRVIGTLALAFGLAGLFLSSEEYNVVAVNGGANLLHFAAAVALLAVGLGTDASPDPAHPTRD